MITQQETRHQHGELPPIYITRSKGKGWKTALDFTVCVDVDDRHVVMTVPAGYEFDLASIPRMFWFIIAPFELSLAAPLVHDFLYEFTGCVNPCWIEEEGEWFVPSIVTRKNADDIFDQLMKRSLIKDWRRRAAYRAVRMFSGNIWKRRVKRSITDRLDRIKSILPSK